jgi:hypothetical protein
MPKRTQVIVIEKGGRGRRLMVRAKKGCKRAFHVTSVTEFGMVGGHYRPTTTKTKTRIDGAWRGTIKVPAENAVKHPDTGLPQVAEILVQMGVEFARLPPGDAEFYWQNGDVRAGMRFYPDKVKPSPAPDQKDHPKP